MNDASEPNLCLMTDNGLGVDRCSLLNRDLVTICLHPAKRNQDVNSEAMMGAGAHYGHQININRTSL